MFWTVKIKKDINWLNENKQLANENYIKTHYLFGLIPIFSYTFQNEHKNIDSKENHQVGFRN